MVDGVEVVRGNLLANQEVQSLLRKYMHPHQRAVLNQYLCLNAPLCTHLQLLDLLGEQHV